MAYYDWNTGFNDMAKQALPGLRTVGVSSGLSDSRLRRQLELAHQNVGTVLPPMDIPSRPNLRSIQRQLAERGFDPGPIDGIKGPLTTAAIKAFQQANGLVVDGIVGPQTRAALEHPAAPSPMPGRPPDGEHPVAATPEPEKARVLGVPLSAIGVRPRGGESPPTGLGGFGIFAPGDMRSSGRVSDLLRLASKPQEARTLGSTPATGRTLVADIGKALVADIGKAPTASGNVLGGTPDERVSVLGMPARSSPPVSVSIPTISRPPGHPTISSGVAVPTVAEASAEQDQMRAPRAGEVRTFTVMDAPKTAPTPMQRPAALQAQRPAPSPRQRPPFPAGASPSMPASASSSLLRLPSGKMVAPGTYRNKQGMSFSVSAGPNGEAVVTPHRKGFVDLGSELNADTILGSILRSKVSDAVDQGVDAAKSSFAPTVENVKTAATDAIEKVAPIAQNIGPTLGNAFGGIMSGLSGFTAGKPSTSSPPTIHAPSEQETRGEQAMMRARPSIARPTVTPPKPMPARPSALSSRMVSNSRPAPVNSGPRTFQGTATGRTYEVGRVYVNGRGEQKMAMPDGTFRKVG